MKNKNLRFHVKVWRRMRKLENVFLLLLGFIQSSNGLYGGVDWTYRNDMRTKGFLISKSTRSVCKKTGWFRISLEYFWRVFHDAGHCQERQSRSPWPRKFKAFPATSKQLGIWQSRGANVYIQYLLYVHADVKNM